MTTETTPTVKHPRVLEVLYSFRIGGSELLGLDLARQMKESGAEVMCTALDGMDGPLVERCAAYGITVVDLGLPIRNALGRNGISLALVKRLKALHLDAIHFQHFLGLNKLGLPARLAGIPRIVVTEHSVLDASQSFAGRLRIRLNWRLAHAITVIHSGIKDYLVSELGVDSKRTFVIPVGVDVEQWHRRDRAECRARLQIDSEIVFVFVGRIAPIKNVPGLIKAFLAIQERMSKPTKLLIVGNGEDMAECQSLVTQHPFGSRVIFAGEQSDTRPYLAAGDIFVMNSKSEGTPRALLEAMAMGLPGVCPAVGGIPAMLNGRGWLTDPIDASTLEAALICASADEPLRTKYSELVRHHVSGNYDSKIILLSYQRLLS